VSISRFYPVPFLSFAVSTFKNLISQICYSDSARSFAISSRRLSLSFGIKFESHTAIFLKSRCFSNPDMSLSTRSQYFAETGHGYWNFTCFYLSL